MRKLNGDYLKRRSTFFSSYFANLLFFALFLHLFAGYSKAQTEDDPVDPLLGDYAIGVSDEIVLLWASSQGAAHFQHKLYDYASKNNPAEPNEIIPLGKDSIYEGLSDWKILDAFSEDINGDGFDDVVSYRASSIERAPVIVIRQVDTITYEFIDAATVDSEGPNDERMVRLVPGNFDSDPESEFLLSYLDDDSKVRIILYDSDGTLLPERKAVLQGDEIFRGENIYINFDIGTGDFDGDGMDEMVLVGGKEKHVYEPDLNKEIDKEVMFLALYDVNKEVEYSFQPGAREDEIDLLNYLIKSNSLNFRLRGLRLTSADFDNNGLDDIAVGYQLAQGDSTYYLLQSFGTSNTLDSVFYTPGMEFVHTKFHKEDASGGGSMTITAGDLTGDGQEEVVFAASRKLKVFGAGPDLQLRQLAEFGSLNSSEFSNDQNNRTVEITDLDASLHQENWHKEVVVVDKVSAGEFSEPAINLFVYEAKTDLSGELKFTQKAFFQELSLPLENDSPLAIVCGNFEGDGMRIGTPRMYRETGVFQPLVVVNAPPVHFDVLNGQSYDISNCFGGDCQFVATYKEGTSLTEQISTQINSDWGLEQKLYTENEIAGIKLNAHMTKSYGGNFSKVKNSSKTVTVSVEVQAVHDDMIYATIGDYTIWEYPVYNDGVFQGYMSTVVPEVEENRWFPSKSWSGNNYMPEHEAGNVLSYPDFVDLEDITSENETIKGLTNNNYALGPSSSYKWSLAFSDFEENSASTSHKVGIELARDVGIGTEGETEVSAAPFGIGGSVSIKYKLSVGRSLKGNFELETFSSHTTSIKKDLALEVKLGSTLGSETGYQVRPFSYWTESGIMVIDYAVDVDQAAQGYTPTWWQDSYGTLPDPALILPWRLDPEKGHALNSDLKRYQTKDIVIYPKDPRPGDTILVYARIHNFSLLPTPDPVNLSFYLGDPEEGGELIESNDGHTMLTTETALSPRSYQWLHMEWIMPEKGRLFAVLDPENSMTEIHENNNKGWIALGPDDLSTGTGELPEFGSISNSERFQVLNYPNPFSESTLITYRLDKDQQVRLRIKDLSGRDVFIREAGYQPAGEYHIEFDGSMLPEGVYLINLELESGVVASHKMMVL